MARSPALDPWLPFRNWLDEPLSRFQPQADRPETASFSCSNELGLNFSGIKINSANNHLGVPSFILSGAPAFYRTDLTILFPERPEQKRELCDEERRGGSENPYRDADEQHPGAVILEVAERLPLKAGSGSRSNGCSGLDRGRRGVGSIAPGAGVPKIAANNSARSPKRLFQVYQDLYDDSFDVRKERQFSNDRGRSPCEQYAVS